jgi:cyclophilin family peptidyl-prolyl cis-trans isomerase
MTCRVIFLLLITAISGFAARPDGLYAVIQTSKGKIVARLEVDLVPITVANYVGLAEGTIANAAFDPGRPYYDGSVFHRVVPGHVIQTGVPQSERAKNPGYMFPNEIHASLSHNRAGMLNMANSGPNTNAAQFCVTLGDRSYLDGDFNVFGEVVEGLDVVMRIAQGDVVESVRIERVGARSEAYHPTTESFRAMVRAAEQQVAEHAEKKRVAEESWIQKNHLTAAAAAGGATPEQPARLRYRGKEVRYVGHVIGRDGPPLEEIAFASSETGLPGYYDEPREFIYEPGKTKVGPNGIVDAAVAAMRPGDRRTVVIPAALGYGKAGFYPPEVKGQRRFVVSPNVLLVYELEAIEVH